MGQELLLHLLLLSITYPLSSADVVNALQPPIPMLIANKMSINEHKAAKTFDIYASSVPSVSGR
jgi:hypothetical protein